jgi:cysteine synthase A
MTALLTSAPAGWLSRSLGLLADEYRETPESPIVSFPLPEDWGIDLYLKDESVLPSGSLKHRLARSLLVHGLVNGSITGATTLVDASSGSTAVSEAWFARLLGLPFVAVVPAGVSPAKVRLIEQFGGEVRFAADPASVSALARQLGRQRDWYFLDQFTLAATATDWRSGNVADEIFGQLAEERFAIPTWIVVGAGTGGTSATIGRYCRYTSRATRLAVVDPEGSAYFASWSKGDPDATAPGSRIEGIGRPTVEKSFVPHAIDEMLAVDDALSVAAMRELARLTGIVAGPSTGTNLAGALRLVARMRASGRTGSVVTLVCDSGSRYAETFYDESWLRRAGIVPATASRSIHTLLGE